MGTHNAQFIVAQILYSQSVWLMNRLKILIQLFGAIVNRDAAGSQRFLKVELRLVGKFCRLA